MLCPCSFFLCPKPQTDTWVSVERGGRTWTWCWHCVGLLPGYSLTLILSARVSTNLIFSICVALVLMNSCHCIILKVVWRSYWDRISCCTLICTLFEMLPFYFSSLFPLPSPQIWHFSKGKTDMKGRQSSACDYFWGFVCFYLGLCFASQHLNCFCTADKDDLHCSK